jgi:hypothetical protein
VENSNSAIGSLPTLQIPQVIVELFEKIYGGEPILTVVSNIGEDAQYRPLFRSPTLWRYWKTIIVGK